ncbi:MAG: hypothetical protein CVV21_09060 [Candidatus Goldiibacteriota bacterium HGW-Goldbacteria-1]|jgi:hypothetical protein|nr:MAG: hypothetical protein CVV21_09060 [Candidatus Goldiibacteriota bacterium HGW-Goldbacteria-1]
MKPFDCETCGLKIKDNQAVVRWHYDREKKSADTFQTVHPNTVCCDSKEGFFNRSLELMYVFAKMPEFIKYISRLKHDKKELKKFVDRIEKGRSYIRRHNADKNEVKKLIIRLEGLE